MRRTAILGFSFILCAAGVAGLARQGGAPEADAGQGAEVYATPADLGRALFSDTDLSANRSQSCASCHDPANGFADPRDTVAGRAVSLGDDGHSLGDRNAPTAAYARFSPRFHRLEDGSYIGGQFHDGRAGTLADQAGGPPLNPIEMGMPHKAGVVGRLRENPSYVIALKSFFGNSVLESDDAAYAAMTEAIAAFEQTPEFSPFDSKYDRWLRGEYKMSREEELGRVLFFSNQFSNCSLCHRLHSDPLATEETFSNYAYHNIGVPENRAARAVSGATGPDHGLMANPAVDDPAQDGKFKVPTLRNIAVTGPYMHNGVFSDLRTVILFYNKYNSKTARRQINPETGLPFDPPEVPANLSMKELETGDALDDRRIDALVAFLKTLTDQRYEALLAQ